MNLNELVINRGRGRGKRCIRNKNYTDMGLPPVAPPVKKKDYTPSSDLNWGKSHISVPNTSSTHKSASNSKISFEEDSRVIVALTEGRGEARCEVGIAAINVSKPLLILCQISDTQSYINTLTKINIFSPQEILVPITFVENFSGNRLIDKVKEHFPRIKYTGCPRSTFNKTNGMDILSNLCIPSLNAILLVLEHRYYALSAASALVTYIQDSLFVYYATGSIKIDYQESEGYAIIDVSTADRLELVCSAKPAQGNRYSSLFGVLNHCVTKIGSRTLRSCILQPPCKIQYIDDRLNAVTELTKHPEMLLSIQALLQKVSNIDLLLSIATLVPDDPQSCSNRQLNYILLINTLVDLITPLKDIVSKSTHPFFVQLTETLTSNDFTTVKDIVRNTVQENAHPAKGQAAVMQRCFAIKAGINGLLDLVRKTYSERLDDMREYVKSLAEKYDLALTLGNNQTKGHHIVLSLNQKQKRYMKKSDLPEEFIEVYRLAGSFTMKTPELVNLSTRLDDIMADILRISNVMVHSIIIEVKKYVTLFYKLCEEIAQLDVLQSLAECSIRNGYIRPKFGSFTEVTFAHHPLLDFLLSTKPVPNPISCSDDYNLHIITGPNGSGKSIFIRQVMLLQIMAQVGCYVPAQSATFRPADRMFARIYLEDNMEHGASSFILEMKEIKYIMTTMTNNSLVIIDELCRSTSLEEGTALAIAVVEKLAQSSAFIYITTHFTLLTKLYDLYLNVKVWQLETIPSGEDPKTFKLDFRHNLVPGVTSVKRYGVYIVRNIWPDSILKHVDTILDTVSNKPKHPNIVPLDAKVRLKYKIESQFRKLKSQHKLTVAEVNKLLNQYQSELEKLEYNVNVVPLLPTNLAGNMVQEVPRIEHSIFGDIQENFIEGDLQEADDRIKQNFTPELYASNQMFMNLGLQETEERMHEVFTPEVSQLSQHTNYTNQRCPNLDFYQNYQHGNESGDIFGEAAQNFFGANEYQNCDNSLDNFENISRFIAENSENINKLIPEVNLSYDNISKVSQNSLQIHRNVSNSSNQPSLEISKDMNDFRFSLPLQKNLLKTSTPLLRKPPESVRIASPLIKIYGTGKHSTSLNTNDQNNHGGQGVPDENELEDLDLESIQEDLEVCSHIFGEEGDQFEEESLDVTYNSLPNSDKPKEEIQQRIQVEKFQHFIPIVTVIEGPNNTTLSFDETSFKHISKEELGLEEKINNVAQKKINIISDVVIAPKRIPGTIVKQDLSTEIKELEVHEVSDAVMEDCLNNTEVGDENMISPIEETPVAENKYIFEEIKVEGESKRYKNFDSTFEAALTNSFQSLQHVHETFKSFTEDDTHSLYSCESSNFNIQHEDLPNVEKSKCSSSGYEVTAITDPKKFITSSSVDDEENVKEKNDTICEDNKAKSSSNKTAMTSISFASKLRNLEPSTSDSNQQEDSNEKKSSCDKSLSNTSKERNLDQVADSTTPNEKSESKTKEEEEFENSSSLKESDESKSNPKTLKRKFFSSRSRTVKKDSQSTDSGENKKRCVKKKFIPPRKLSAKEIREEFKEQDRKILESSPNSSNFSKYLEQLIKRPTVKQVQKTTHLAMIRKTEEGVEVIPAKPMKKKPKITQWKKHSSNENFNVAIFSDKNALPFQNYLNSNEKDYHTFSFNFNKTQASGQKFEFEPTTLKFGEYTNNSVTNRFVRTISETISSQQSRNAFGVENAEKEANITFRCVSQQSVNQVLTPDGFYKDNKDDIERILYKYLQNDNPKEKPAENFDGYRSIFDNNDIDPNDLNI